MYNKISINQTQSNLDLQLNFVCFNTSLLTGSTKAEQANILFLPYVKSRLNLLCSVGFSSNHLHTFAVRVYHHWPGAVVANLIIAIPKQALAPESRIANHPYYTVLF